MSSPESPTPPPSLPPSLVPSASDQPSVEGVDAVKGAPVTPLEPSSGDAASVDADASGAALSGNDMSGDDMSSDGMSSVEAVSADGAMPSGEAASSDRVVPSRDVSSLDAASSGEADPAADGNSALTDPSSDAPQPASASSAPATSSSADKRAAHRDCGPLLRKRFPALFGGGPKPLKLRIQVDIQERAPGVFSKQALSAFFRRYTGGTAYLQAVAHGAHRLDLDGHPVCRTGAGLM